MLPAWPPSYADRLEVVSLDEKHHAHFERWMVARVLDLGEAQAIALAQQLDADWFLTDDSAARVVAGREGLEVHGSLGVLLWAAATGRMDRHEARAGLERLAASTLWISRRVLAQAREALDLLLPGP